MCTRLDFRGPDLARRLRQRLACVVLVGVAFVLPHRLGAQAPAPLDSARGDDLTTAPETISPRTTQVVFTSTNAIFPNPDRGLYTWTYPGYANYAAVRAAGYTLVRQYLHARSLPAPAAAAVVPG